MDRDEVERWRRETRKDREGWDRGQKQDGKHLFRADTQNLFRWQNRSDKRRKWISYGCRWEHGQVYATASVDARSVYVPGMLRPSISHHIASRRIGIPAGTRNLANPQLIWTTFCRVKLMREFLDSREMQDYNNALPNNNTWNAKSTWNIIIILLTL